MNDNEILHLLTTLALSEKSMSGVPDWRVEQRQQGNRLRLVCPLWIEDVVAEGLRLELAAPETQIPTRPFKDVTALLLATADQQNWILGRIEVDPTPVAGPNHFNPADAKDLAPRITGPHIHPFQRNAERGLAALSPEQNLPCAVSVERTFLTFDDILTVIREEFVIPGLWFEEPRWNQLLV